MSGRARPRPSAVAILVAPGPDGELRALVGRRNPRSRFLGGFYAFPGGVLEEIDGDPAHEGEDAVLRRTAARELEEETGIRVAPEAFRPAGRRVTPPFAPRRFDSPMWVAALDAPVEPRPVDPGELLDMEWARPEELFARWRALEIRIAPPLIPMLDGLARGAAGGDDLDALAARLAAINDAMEADGPRIEFVPDVLMLTLETATLPPATHTNAYLVGSRDFLVIDPGSAQDAEIARLLRHVGRRADETGGRAIGVVVTHHHGDHTGGAAAVARALGIPVLAHPETWARWRGADGGTIERRDLADGERIELSGGERLEVLHTPGHAAGHVALLEETQGSLFAGDLVSGVSTILIDSPPGSLDRFLASLVRIRDCGARTLFPGHGPPQIDPAGTVGRVLGHRARREALVLAAVREGRADAPVLLETIVRSAYADTPDAAPQLAASQAVAHLDRLEGLGRVQRTAGGWIPTEPPPSSGAFPPA